MTVIALAMAGIFMDLLNAILFVIGAVVVGPRVMDYRYSAGIFAAFVIWNIYSTVAGMGSQDFTMGGWWDIVSSPFIGAFWPTLWFTLGGLLSVLVLFAFGRVAGQASAGEK